MLRHSWLRTCFYSKALSLVVFIVRWEVTEFQTSNRNLALLYIITAPGKDLKILQSVGQLVRCVQLTFYCDNAYTVRIHAWTHTPWITWHVYRGKECSCPAVCAALSLNTSVKLQCSPPVQSYWTAWGFLTNCPCIFDKQKAPALMHFWATLAPRLLSA